MTANTTIFIFHSGHEQEKKYVATIQHLLKDYYTVKQHSPNKKDVNYQTLPNNYNINCDSCLLLVSHICLISEDCVKELLALFKKYPKKFVETLIPIILPMEEHGERPYLLFSHQFIHIYVSYWNQKVEQTNRALKQLHKEQKNLKSIEQYEKARKNYLFIRDEISNLINIINMRYSIWQDTQSNGFKDILERLPPSEKSLIADGKIEKQLGQIDALSEIDIIIQCNAIGRMPLGEERDIAIEELRLELPKNRHILFCQAKNEHDNNRFKKAEYFYTYLLSLYPSDYKALNNLAVLYKDTLQMPQKALVLLQKAISINQTDSLAYTNIASLYTDYFDDKEQAKKYYLEAITHDAQNAHAYLNYARTLNKYDADNATLLVKAEQYYQIAITYDPNIVEAYYNLANLQWSALNKKQEAKENYLKALTIKPNFVEALVNLSALLLEIGEVPLAKQYYQKAKEIPTTMNFYIAELESNIE